MIFPERTTFWDVEGIPVTLGGADGVPYSAAWDGEVPRPFPPESVRRNGAQISLDAFNALVASFRAGHQQQHGSNETMSKPSQ
jgi:hypothetical protein